MKIFGKFCLVILATMLAVTASAEESKPKSTTDGLELVSKTRSRAVYMKPGAHLDIYTEVALLEPYVAFAKNWQREHNEEEMTLDGQVTDKDMARMRKALAADFVKVFTEVLTKAGHKMVSTGGTGVLIIRPAILNLRVTAPDLMTAGMETNFVASAGSMTLYMELLDGRTGDLIARVFDAEADRMGGYSNRVTNTADAEFIIRNWASTLNKHLGEVKKLSN